MDELRAGLYERLVTKELALGLEAIAPDLVAKRDLRADEAPDRIFLFIADLVRSALADIPEEERASRGAGLVHTLVEQIAEHLPALAGDLVDPETVLRAILTHDIGGRPGRSVNLSSPC